jgi:hypothetical protein
MTIESNIAKFVHDADKNSRGEYAEKTRNEIAEIRNAHQELSSWGDLAIGIAWGDYSQDELEVNWCDWLVGKRDEEFLKYIENR